MANKYLDTTVFDKAVSFAMKAHANTERRGKGLPYSVHLMEAVEIVATMTTDQELLAAAMLHDVIEDTDVTTEDVRLEFGDRIAELVSSESDIIIEGESEYESWYKRKESAIKKIAALDRAGKIVAMGDKLSNMRAIARDYDEIGDALWDRFHAPDPRLHRWHYEGLAVALADLKDTTAYQEFVVLIDDVFTRAFGKVQSKFIDNCEKIDINDWVAFGDGYTAVSYYHKTDPDIMMKLYAPFIPMEKVVLELEQAQHVLDSGVATPKPEKLVVAEDGRYGCSFRRIHGKRSIARAMSEEPDNIEEYSIRFARMCKNLHSRKADTVFFKPVSETYKKLIRGLTNFTVEQKLKMIEFLDSVEDTYTCIHGDLHSGNALITEDGEELFIDLADFSYGNPLFDLGTLFFTSNMASEELTFKLYHCHKDQMRRHWIAFVKEYFGVSSDADVDEIEKRIAPFAAMKIIFFAELDHWTPDMKAGVCALMGFEQSE